MLKNTTLSIRLADRLKLFPDSTSIQNDALFIAGCDLGSLAAEYGTPLYIYDLLTLNNAVTDYQSALRKYYPAPSHITYAGKAFLCKAIAEWTQTQDLLVDCTGEGEIGIAVAGGLLPSLQERAPALQIWLRLLPGVSVHTHHAHTETGQHSSKFGMTRPELLEAAKFCKENELPLKGIHFHLGSNFRDPEPLISAIELALDLAKEIGFTEEWHFC